MDHGRVTARLDAFRWILDTRHTAVGADSSQCFMMLWLWNCCVHAMFAALRSLLLLFALNLLHLYLDYSQSSILVTPST